MAIPKEIIDKIQDSTDIIDIISGYLSLKKAGRNYKARCPFHHEKTPSFVVNPDKQIFHCFGCGAGGNVFGFLMKHENMDFPEAVRLLAEKSRIALPAYSQEQRRSQTLADQLYKLNEIACAFYQSYLAKDKNALTYLTERGIGPETVRTFRLGLAPDSWDALLIYFKKRNVSPALVEKAGLAVAKENGSYYDRFRDRIIFPIFDVRGRVLGFGARVRGEGMPKYLNSPETHIYSKGKQLYGFNFTKDFIRKERYAIMAEGYFDLIVPFQAGVKNIIATLGTALTEGQMRLLKRFCNTVITIFDPDDAGEAATLRSLDLFMAEGINVYVAALPAGYDPDAYIRKFGFEQFKDTIKTAKNLFDYKLGLMSSRYNPKTMNGKVAIVNEMLPTLAKIGNEVLKSGLVKKLAEALSVDEEAVRAELKKVKPEFGTNVPAVEPGLKSSAGTLSKAEKILLALMIEKSAYVTKVKELIQPEELKGAVIRKIVQALFRLQGEDAALTPSQLINYFGQEDGAGALISEAAAINEIIEDKEKALKDCIGRIKTDHLKGELTKLQAEIKTAHSSKDENRLQELVVRYSHLIKRNSNSS